MYERSHLGTLDAEGMLRAFSRVYEKYVVPMHLTAEQLRLHVETNDVALEHSPLWLDGSGETVGLGLLGVRGDRGWVGGFGIAPPYRGKGISKQISQEILDRARSLGMKQVQLEVLTNNPFAVRTYAGTGYTMVRDLRVFVRPPDAAAPRSETEAPVVEASPAALLNGGEQRGIRPPWQREPASLRGLKSLQGFVVGPPSAPRAFALARAGAEGVRFADLQAPDPAAVPELVAALAQRFPARAMTLLNEPEESPACEMLERAGFKEQMRQHEMIAHLGAG